MANPLYASRKEVGAGEFSVLVAEGGGANQQARAVVAGYYYNDSATAAESLVTAIKTTLDLHSTLGVFTVTVSLTTGLITISNAVTFELDFSAQTDFRDWLGFNSTTKTGANSYTGDVPMQGFIFAAGGREKYTGIRREKTTGTVVCESGVVAHISSGSTRRHASWLHGFEPPASVASPLASGAYDDAGTVVPWTWADFWEHHTETGEPFRYYTQAGLAVGAFEDTYVLHESAYKEFDKDRIEDSSDVYWGIKLVVRKAVDAS